MTTEPVKLEYIWIDNDALPRGKTMIYTKPFNGPEDLPLWNYDGSSTGQATTSNSDVIIRPVAIFNDPFRGGNHKIVLTETLNGDLTPHPTNYRAPAVEIFNRAGDSAPQFGMEQEYILFSRQKEHYQYFDHQGIRKIENITVPYKWISHGDPGKGEQGPYYCSAGGGTAFGRQLAEEHLDACLQAGLKICGLNAEVMPSQWEFQIGICDDIEMGDHLWVARYILLRLSEKYDIDISFHPKPYKGNWNGSGLHTNYSTVQMREGVDDKTGLDFIVEACEALCAEGKHKPHMDVYGSDNHERMTGAHETASYDKCTWGKSDRGQSIRIPILVTQNKKGYLEDRRVASNADPYRVTSRIVQTTVLGE